MVRLPRYNICGQIKYIMKTSENFEGKYDQRVGQSIKGIGFYVGCHNFGNMNCNRAGRPVQPDSWSPSDFLGHAQTIQSRQAAKPTHMVRRKVFEIFEAENCSPTPKCEDQLSNPIMSCLVCPAPIWCDSPSKRSLVKSSVTCTSLPLLVSLLN